MINTNIIIKNLVIDNNKAFTLIAGPCVIESKEHALKTADKLANICRDLDLEFIY